MGAEDSLVVDINSLRLSGEGVPGRVSGGEEEGGEGEGRLLDDATPATFKAEFYLIPKSEISTTEKPDPKMKCCWDGSGNFCDYNIADEDKPKEDHLPKECKGDDGKASCSARMYLDFDTEPMGGGGMSGVFQSKVGGRAASLVGVLSQRFFYFKLTSPLLSPPPPGWELRLD